MKTQILCGIYIEKKLGLLLLIKLKERIINLKSYFLHSQVNSISIVHAQLNIIEKINNYQLI